ncbi:MAG: hypothetical protein JOZ61_02475, partial [Verrucomicrobia bacterium]|nr:hypothetical protein [Verrucomicrobiota bacterium]
MIELSKYAFESLRTDEEFTLYRGHRVHERSTVAKASDSILLLAPVFQQPALRMIKRLEHEYSLRDKLDPDCAVRPIELAP